MNYNLTIALITKGGAVEKVWEPLHYLLFVFFFFHLFNSIGDSLFITKLAVNTSHNLNMCLIELKG